MTWMILAASGMAGGVLFGKWQLSRWNAWNRKYQVILFAFSGILFLYCGYFMVQYKYHALKMVRYWILMYALLLLGILDHKEQMIPNRALAVLLGVRMLLLVAECISFPGFTPEIVVSSFAGLAGGGLMFLLAGIIARKGIGMGDVKLIGVMGYYLGFRVLMSDLVITLALTVLGGLCALMFRKASLRSEMPFAPFAAAGTMITILLGF